jgi:hypothetical protein
VQGQGSGRRSAAKPVIGALPRRTRVADYSKPLLVPDCYFASPEGEQIHDGVEETHKPDLLLCSPVRRRLSATQVLVAVALVLSATNAITVYSAPTRTVSVPTGVGCEGYLIDSFGVPLTGSHNLT